MSADTSSNDDTQGNASRTAQTGPSRLPFGLTVILQIGVVVFAGAAIVGAGSYLLSDRLRKPEDTARGRGEVIDPTSSSPGTSTDDASFRTAQGGIVAQSQRLAETGHQRQLAEKARRRLEAEKALTEEFDRLESDERGRRIAADETSLRRYVVLNNSARVGGQMPHENGLERTAAEIQRIQTALAAVVNAASHHPPGPATLKEAVAAWNASREQRREELTTARVQMLRSQLEKQRTKAMADRDAARKLFEQANDGPRREQPPTSQGD